MELGLALTIRVYGVLPDIVLRASLNFASNFMAANRRAYLEADRGLGVPIFVPAGNADDAGFSMSGVYLDLQLTYSAGRLSSIEPPRTLSPFTLA